MSTETYNRPEDISIDTTLTIITKENKDKDHYQMVQLSTLINGQKIVLHEMYLKDSLRDIINLAISLKK